MRDDTAGDATTDADPGINEILVDAAVKAVVVLVVLLAFQYVSRGEVSLPIAVGAAVGFFVVQTSVEYYRLRH
ncbi:hypothetical protein OB919_11510 [Halobacteria archaeon AArc-curdl1]|uniref:Uncharacterized protein n=1 Tax=Natronosalvus hydrolyticus TaxID=2979988 RepID=A0AAP2Z8D7_9EURY|nr:hypothetical protein [Halobacteria archaeon AArc-curdl1]